MTMEVSELNEDFNLHLLEPDEDSIGDENFSLPVGANRPSQEVPPKMQSRATENVRKLVDRVKKAPGNAIKNPVRRPRVSVEKLISGAWGLLARVAQPVSLPVARVMAVQAPVAGMVLEDVVKNTVMDKLLQPIARAGEGGEIAFALFGPPLLVGALERKPELSPILVPMLKQALGSWIDIAGPKLEKMEKREAEFKNNYGKRIDEMIEFFFSPIEDISSDTQ